MTPAVRSVVAIVNVMFPAAVVLITGTDEITASSVKVSFGVDPKIDVVDPPALRPIETVAAAEDVTAVVEFIKQVPIIELSGMLDVIVGVIVDTAPPSVAKEYLA